MRRKRFSGEQIVSILKESEAGMKSEEVCRRHGIGTNTFYRWKARYADMEISDIRKPKPLEDENTRLTRIVTEQALDIQALRGGSQKSYDAPPAPQRCGCIDPGRPMQNAFIESFNGKFRDELLDQNWFMDLADAKEKIESRRQSFNTVRPQSSLNDDTPAEFAGQFEEQKSNGKFPRAIGLTGGAGHVSRHDQGEARVVAERIRAAIESHPFPGEETHRDLPVAIWLLFGRNCFLLYLFNITVIRETMPKEESR